MAEHLDRIYIRDLSFRCIIGCLPEERDKLQDVIVNLTLYADLRAAGASDALGDTVDYKAVKQAILKAGESSSFQLVERLAEEIVSVVFAADARVQAVRVTVDKPGALRFTRSVAIEMYRERQRNQP